MNNMTKNTPLKVSVLGAVLISNLVYAAPYIQCPAPLLTLHGTFDPKNPAASTDLACRNPSDPNYYDNCKVLIDPITGQPSGATTDPNVVCRSITCGDGHVNMADGNDIYIFGFSDVTNVPESQIATRGNPVQGDSSNPPGFALGRAETSAPTFFATEGQALYLTLTNTGFRERPDLFDPHTVHYHGFPNASSVFDGEPMASLAIGVGESITYYYLNENAGTYMWHCHREAAEHMQMGMLGQLYIRPHQDNDCKAPSLTATSAPQCFKTPSRRWAGFAYDDGDGSTGYDKMFFLQETAFDPVFHNADHSYQKIPFANMNDTYPLFNGRGYPDTVNPARLVNQTNGHESQKIPAIAMDYSSGTGVPRAINRGDRVLVHLSSLSTVDFFTVTLLGIPMRVVGQGAQLRRGPSGIDTSYDTNSITIGGGEGVDVILDTTNVSPGTYFMYTTNLNGLSNDAEDFGGMMTEIVVRAP